MFKILAVMLALAFGGGDKSDPYAPGQVWEYRTRPQEPGSRVLVRAVEDYGDQRVYHISIVGLRPSAPDGPTEIDHTQVSRQTLDASVTRLSSDRPKAPDYRPGVAEWRANQGGVFTVTVAEIVQMVDDMTPAR